MPNPPRTADHIREAVAEDIIALAGTPEGSVRAIAHKHRIGKTTVGRIADEYGLADAWAENTSQTEQATATRRAHIARQRALLQEDLLDAAADLVNRLHQEVIHLNVVKRDGENAGEYVEQTELAPGPAEWRSTMAAISAATRSAVDLAKLDNDTSRTDATVGLLDQFAADLARDLGNEEDPPASEPA